ncbi:MAG: hypothetical protein JW940_11145, partial [Polyangiaceae bacterium]|nr:hypothetical protein [Polyangiaceae bacterium]
MASSRTTRFIVAASAMLGMGLVLSQGCAVIGDYEFEKDYKRAPGGTGAAGPAGGCKPYNTCDDEECGQIDDGCGNPIVCGTCPEGEYCGNPANRCSNKPCTEATSCADLDSQCGWTPNCDNALFCGDCPTRERCNIDNHRCECAPFDCNELQAQCGEIDNGCGVTMSCGECLDGQVCHGNRCCVPSHDCGDAECGKVSDGCGGVIDCGQCATGLVCGTVEPNQCSDTSDCTLSEECLVRGWQCDMMPICGGETKDCGTCPSTADCVHRTDAAGVEYTDCVCRNPLTCEGLGAQCGEIFDGCGNIVQCDNHCSDDQVCDHTACCTPKKACDQGQCGEISDNCGGSIDCGACPGGVKCEADNQCCVPETCEDAGAECGEIYTCETWITCEDTCPLHDCVGNSCGCKPAKTCESEQWECGALHDDQCGDQNCGTCSAGAYCNPTTHSCCTPMTECPPELVCGTATDPCSGQTFGCGSCNEYEDCSPDHRSCVCKANPCEGVACGQITCGGNPYGCPNTCTGRYQCQGNSCVCVPATCAELGACNISIGDGCGGNLECGACSGARQCTNGQCCTPHTCGANECGDVENGDCGGTRNCGACGGNDKCVDNTCCTPRMSDCDSVPCGGSIADEVCGGNITCLNTCGADEVCYDGACCTPVTLEDCGPSDCGKTLTNPCGDDVSCPSCGTGGTGG